MTLRSEYEQGSSRSTRKTQGKAPLCQVCKRHITGLIIPRSSLLIEIRGNEGSKRFDHRVYHPTCSDRIRSRAARLL